ncbi:putative lipoprotein YmbA [Geothermobacter ehrlichii]|uniref:Putative lipoprotein YmbA n=1 Tax=Geothermobacter ehrlichii TaxID=213224 RepID=A0A5D3WFY4_9BACT|nr:PqiC family protein [Geothermobacter ehrlichii]TYO95856.1 putative lipoprotein YmbA [Geothermobacter ehrlichii]
MTRLLKGTTAVLLVLLCGCVNLGQGTSPSRHYLIPSLADRGIAPRPERKPRVRLTLLPVKAAAYLDRQELVRRLEANRIELLPFDRWAEPPTENLQRVVAENLVRLADDIVVASDGELQLAMVVERLEGRKQGALMQLAWRLFRRQTGEDLAGGVFRRELPLPKAEAGQMVAAYGEMAEAFCRELLARLATIPQAVRQKEGIR